MQQSSTLSKIISNILLLILSAVFLFSAGSKLLAIEPFEWSILDVLPIEITAAAIIARLFIGLEFLLGLLLLFQVGLRRYTYRFCVLLLLAFTAYLLVLLVRTGNNGNCGCFGDAVQMKPLTAIFKNIAMLVIVFVLQKIYTPTPYKKQWIVFAIATAASFTVPFVIQPVYIYSPGKVIHQPIRFDALYRYGNPKPTIDLGKGKRIVIFYSLTCPHCRTAAKQLQRLYSQYPQLPIYSVLGGHKEDLASFLKDAGWQAAPYTFMDNSLEFSRMAGETVPAIFWVENGIAVLKTNYAALVPAKINKWLDGK